MHYEHIRLPEGGEPVTANPDFTLNVPHRPIIPFIEGDGKRLIRKPKAGEAKEAVEEELQRLVPGAKLVGTRGFAATVIRHMHE